ncbi:SCAN domain-containing protein 3-like protein [Perkinsela sp. CCAP 1560/4]|nr:SCAN domain-containing protein 3-like protein [Perkinsela sp. CCAP 1560/4]|eukprot:KNH06243.1 SCAN domain-containing protein 3-like protein [Perkinsela sp. CCAP 1560/4]
MRFVILEIFARTCDTISSCPSQNVKATHRLLGIIRLLLLSFQILSYADLMIATSVVLGTDPLLGRLDCAPFSQQALMELLIAGIEKVDEICGSRQDPKDVTEWKGLTFGTETDGVIQIEWSYTSMRGSIDVQWPPAILGTLWLSTNNLSAEPMEGHLFVMGQDESCGEVQETAVCCSGGSWILLVARRANVHSFSVD